MNSFRLIEFLSSDCVGFFSDTTLAAFASTLSRRGIDIHPALHLLRLRGVHDSLLDIPGEQQEGLLDVDVGLCGDFHEWDSELVGERLATFGGNDALLFPVALVADEDFVDALGCVLFDVLEPGLDVLRYVLASVSPPLPFLRSTFASQWRRPDGRRHTTKRTLVRYIVHQQYPHGTTVIRRRNRPKPFLSCPRTHPSANHPISR